MIRSLAARERRLCAIMFTDVARSTALAQADKSLDFIHDRKRPVPLD